MRLILLTLGFDEKFAVRSILRCAPKSDDVIVIVTASPMPEKAEKALKTLLDIVKSYAGIENIEIIEVDVSNPQFAKHEVRRLISKYDAGIIANLSGGMRMLILVTLAAVLSSNRDASIELETENLENLVTLDPDFFKPEPITESDRQILRKIEELGEVRLDGLAEITEKSRTSTYRTLKNLVNAGCIIEKRVGRGVIYKLSEKGVAILNSLDSKS